MTMDIVIVEAVRSPIGRRGGGLSTFHSVDLLAGVLGELVGSELRHCDHEPRPPGGGGARRARGGRGRTQLCPTAGRCEPGRKAFQA